MANSPIRAAFRALSLSVGLSLCVLAIGALSGELASTLPVPDAIRWTSHMTPGPVGKDAAAESASDEAPPRATRFRSTEPSAEPGIAAAVPWAGPETSLPAEAVSLPGDSVLPLIVEESSRPTRRRGEFIELPPPPHFADSPGETEAASSGASPDPTERIAELETRLEGLHAALLGDLARVQESQETLYAMLAGLVPSEPVVENATPPPVRLDVTMLLMPRKASQQPGALELIAGDQARPELTPAVGATRPLRWGVSRAGAVQIADWLERHAGATWRRQTSIHLPHETSGHVDLTQVDASQDGGKPGQRVIQRILTAPWEGLLALRGGIDASGMGRIEFLPGHAAETAWLEAVLPADGTLILTTMMNEQYLPVPPDAAAEDDLLAPSPPRRSRTELILLVTVHPLEADTIVTPPRSIHVRLPEESRSVQ